MSKLLTPRDDRGSTMIMALVFLAVFSLFLAVLVPFATTGFKVSGAVETQRNVVYAADAAVEANVKALQPSNGDCSKAMPSLPTFDGQAVTVTCVSGTSGAGAPVNVNNRPGQAILTLGRSTGEVGFSKFVGSTSLRVHGGVFSNSNIVAIGKDPPGAVVVDKGNIRARTGCSGIVLNPSTTTTTTPSFTSNCSLRNASDPAGDDPNYPPAVASPPPAAPALPACTQTVTLSPGTYNDAVALSALASNCNGALIWFQPGVYYFNFTNAGSHQFSIQGGATLNVVAGRPKGWVPPVSPSSRPAVPIPGGCTTEADVQPPPYPANIGVQFIFGGDSTFSIKSGNVEICAQPSTTVQQIALYGVRPHVAPEPASPFQEEFGCVITVGGCDLVSTGPGNNAVLVVQGTVYMPAGSINLSMPNNSITKFFGRGVIARTLAISIPGSQDGNTAIEIPDFSAGTTTGYPFQEVLLTATINGVVRLRARVHYENTPGTPTVTVKDWSITS